MPTENADLRILLVSCYELGQQPLGIAWPAGFLKRAGFAHEALDLATESVGSHGFSDADGAPTYDLVAISTPMHTALTMALPLVKRIQKEAPSAHLCVFGHYAHLHRDRLRRLGVDSILSAECEEELVQIARSLDGNAPSSDHPAQPNLSRLAFPLPDRSGLASLSAYTRLEVSSETRLVGSVESTRGCRHLCRHCPIPAVYHGKVFVVAREVVGKDIDQLIEAGARHIHFVDADFLNAPKHALDVCRDMNIRHPEVTFDFTAKVEHLLKHEKHLEELAGLGCLFITTAVESLSDLVLERLDKGHRRHDVDTLRGLMADAGIAMKPTWLPFTPWTTPEDYLDILDWIADAGLVQDTDLIQLTIRLLVPPGSLLLSSGSLAAFLDLDDTDALSAQWTHPDLTMDELQRELAGTIERLAGASPSLSHLEGFRTIVQIAEERLGSRGRDRTPSFPASAARQSPRLTEHWFC